jgi:hypothetical protein
MKLITLLAVLACACGKSDGAGTKSSGGNPAMLKEGEELAKRFCECPDRACADGVKSADGRTAYPYFMKADESSMTEAEQQKWRDAKMRWNDCARPGYFKKK